MQARPHGIMFHHFFGGNHYAGQGAISGEQFADIIEYLGRDRILSAQEWVARTQSGTLGTSDICLTFDDALLCQYEIALPVLQSYSLTGFWFVYTSVVSGSVERLEVFRKFRTVMFENMEVFYAEFFRVLGESDHNDMVAQSLHRFVPERYLAEFPFYTNNDRKFRYIRDKVLGPLRYNQVMELMLSAQGIDMDAFSADLWMQEHHLKSLHAEAHIIGLHSHTHPTALADMPEQQQRSEYEANFSVLYRILGEAPKTMSHPCNSYNDLTLSILRKMGICVGFRANMATCACSELEFPREDHANIIGRLYRKCVS